MNRQKTLNKAFQRGNFLTLKNPTYKNWFDKFMVQETKADIGKGDLTSNAVVKNKIVKAIVKTRENGIIAGLEEAVYLYRKFNIKVMQIKKDGQKVKKGDILLKLKGKERDLLKVERSALDLMQRMSGIATLTNNTIKKIKNKVKISPTRKTQWRYLDKKATYLGNALTHRLALWESILIKDNHLNSLKKDNIKDPIQTAILRAYKKRKKSIFIEIEVQNKKDAITAAKTFSKLKNKLPFLIMLDNMNPKQITDTINNLKKLNLYNNVLIEASGGITPKTINKYVNTGIDVISMGFLTHSQHTLDIKQKIL